MCKGPVGLGAKRTLTFLLFIQLQIKFYKWHKALQPKFLFMPQNSEAKVQKFLKRTKKPHIIHALRQAKRAEKLLKQPIGQIKPRKLLLFLFFLYFRILFTPHVIPERGCRFKFNSPNSYRHVQNQASHNTGDTAYNCMYKCHHILHAP